MTHMFIHPDPMLVATRNATASEIMGEKSSIVRRRSKALTYAKTEHRAITSVTTARKAVAMSQVPNTLAHEAMQASIAGMRAAKLARDRERDARRRK